MEERDEPLFNGNMPGMYKGIQYCSVCSSWSQHFIIPVFRKHINRRHACCLLARLGLPNPLSKAASSVTVTTSSFQQLEIYHVGSTRQLFFKSEILYCFVLKMPPIPLESISSNSILENPNYTVYALESLNTWAL